MAKSIYELFLQVRAEQAKRELADLERRGKQTATGLKGAFSNAGTFMRTVFASAIIFASARMMDLAANIENVTDAFSTMTQSFGADGKKLLESIKTASKGMISEFEIMKNANLAMSLMGEKVIDHLPKMAEIAVATSKALGKNVKEQFTDIIVASGRQSVQVLDNVGISSAKASKLIDEYAASLGKTRNQLTASEKAQGFFNAMLIAGQEAIDKVDISTLTFADRVQILKTRIEDTKNQLAVGLIPAFEDLIEIANTDIGEDSLIAKLVKAIRVVTLGIRGLVVMIGGIPAVMKQALDDATVTMKNAIKQNIMLWQQVPIFGKLFKGFDTKLTLPKLSKDYIKFIENLQKLKKAWADIDKPLEKSFNKVFSKVNKNTENTTKNLTKKLKRAVDTFYSYTLSGLEKTLYQLDKEFEKAMLSLHQQYADKLILPEEFVERNAAILKKFNEKMTAAYAEASQAILTNLFSMIDAQQNEQLGNYLTNLGAIVGTANKEYGAIITSVGIGVSLFEKALDKNKETRDVIDEQSKILQEIDRLTEKHIADLDKALTAEKKLNQERYEGTRKQLEEDLRAAETKKEKLFLDPEKGAVYREYGEDKSYQDLLAQQIQVDDSAAYMATIQNLVRSAYESVKINLAPGAGVIAEESYSEAINSIDNSISKINEYKSLLTFPEFKSKSQKFIDDLENLKSRIQSLPRISGGYKESKEIYIRAFQAPEFIDPEEIQKVVTTLVSSEETIEDYTDALKSFDESATEAAEETTKAFEDDKVKRLLEELNRRNEELSRFYRGEVLEGRMTEELATLNIVNNHIIQVNDALKKLGEQAEAGVEGAAEAIFNLQGKLLSLEERKADLLKTTVEDSDPVKEMLGQLDKQNEELSRIARGEVLAGEEKEETWLGAVQKQIKNTLEAIQALSGIGTEEAQEAIFDLQGRLLDLEEKKAGLAKQMEDAMQVEAPTAQPIDLKLDRQAGIVDIVSKRMRSLFGGGVETLKQELEGKVTVPGGVLNVAHSLAKEIKKSVPEQQLDILRNIETLAAQRNKFLSDLVNATKNNNGNLALQTQAESAVLKILTRIDERAI